VPDEQVDEPDRILPDRILPDRILVVTAHPDDVDFGVAGSVATWTDAGIDVAYCIVTDGDAGGFDRNVPRHVMAETRRAEQTAAAKVVGVTELHFLGHPDGRVEASLELRRDISRVIRRVRPQRVVAQSPDRNYQRIYASHPDHLATGEATLCAVYPDARNPFAHAELLDEGLDAWTVDEVWIFSAPDPDRFVDITDGFERKLEALQCHASQHPEPGVLEELLRGWSTSLAMAAGYPEGRLAEGFLRVATS
jgi:LmbE family N-acetylglucosaminyl deacetylase